MKRGNVEEKRVEYANGDCYVGEVKDGKKHGKGKLTVNGEYSEDIHVFDGKWKEDEMLGKFRYSSEKSRKASRRLIEAGLMKADNGVEISAADAASILKSIEENRELERARGKMTSDLSNKASARARKSRIIGRCLIGVFILAAAVAIIVVIAR